MAAELATPHTAIYVRDSRERSGPHLAFTRGTWAGFVAVAGRSRYN
ncbi:DUF397 domain-containing protein [Streptomyces sp. TRM68367]|nr:DUF397 domain-containing protein [Streptomyces sp. TRM68367]